MMVTNDIVIEKKFSDDLVKYGVVRIPFLTPDELQQVKDFYAEMHQGMEPPTMYSRIHMTIWHSDLEYKLKVYEGLKAILQPACDRAFQNYRAISHQFIVKMPGAETDFPVHQDWSIVDEYKYPSFNLWLALHDVDESNGAMWVVHGTHNLNRKVRGPGYLFPDYTGILDELRPSMSQYPLKAGQAALFYHSTVHGSPRNLSNEPRIAVQVSIIPKEAPLQVYFQRTPNDKLEVHRPEDNFAFGYEKVREESFTRPPTDSPVEVRPPFQVEPVFISEVERALVI
ncbi:MAG: hypothetical protein GC178_03380 [Flavobacteriales bacterium]|nr:hypothetical protein [Flavobacteriales bacterium]